MIGSNSTVTGGDNLGSLPTHVHLEHGHSSYDDTREMDDDNGSQEGDEVPEHPEEEQEPCIAIACRMLYSLYEFIQSDCVNGNATNDAQSCNMRKPPTPEEEEPASDVVFCTTRSATETVSRLLNCTGRSCAQDSSMLLVLGSVLLKILSWYEALYESEINGLGLPSTLPNGCEDVSSQRHHSDSSQSGNKHSTGPS
ncbi:Ribosomal protein L10e/L16 [Penicillium fimorum]|uniref:Ribosomal protein L10e/L16 n=1 Tax=Penicillium fimorum TaxID=1882269 RepID=A0A9W9Y389_9EURO|nr:Ribosomal protein L10e/L16 [Penicillium fimorum]